MGRRGGTRARDWPRVPGCSKIAHVTAIDSEVIGQRVAEARRGAGLTQADLAREAGLDRSAVAKLEIGVRRVTALELARISEATGRPFEWFLTEPPASIVSYRVGGDAPATSTIDRLLERVARDVEFLQELGQLNVPTTEPAHGLRGKADAAALASQARSALGLDPHQPIADLVGPMAGIGLFAFSQELGEDAPDAATTLLRRGGVTVVNSSRAVGRRRLAAAHELGHYLLADDYTVDWRLGRWSAEQRTESLIDTFARILLLPDASLADSWAELSTRIGVRDAAVRLASEYRVDMSTLALRLGDLKLSEAGDLPAVRNVTTTRADIIEYDLVVPSDLEATTLPRPYEKAVLALYRSERISGDRALELLHGTVDGGALPQLPPVSESEIWKFTS
jgi:transcriptional regulator with XRE-family HTH domain/Zn-dependent peptidase ImmA (M78 family)